MGIKHRSRGYVGLFVLLIGTGIALYVFFQYSPLGNGANDATFSEGVNATRMAEQLQGMADERDELYKNEMQ